MSSGAVLVIDQGTTSTRAIVFDTDAKPIATAQEEFPQFYTRPGWVEHDPRDLWRTSMSTARIVLAKAAEKGVTVAALGIADERLGQAIALVARASGDPADAEPDLREYLARELPAHMQPKAIHWRDALPIGPNGKFDRAALARELAA